MVNGHILTEHGLASCCLLLMGSWSKFLTQRERLTGTHPFSSINWFLSHFSRFFCQCRSSQIHS